MSGVSILFRVRPYVEVTVYVMKDNHAVLLVPNTDNVNKTDKVL